MKLLLDIGNTRIKWAVADENGLHDPGAAVHADVSDAAVGDVMAALPAGLTGAAAVCVGESVVLEALRERLAAAGVELRRIETAPRAAGVSNGYQDFRQLGADRWAAIVGGWAHTQAETVVVDAGTAVTIDLIAGDGRHLGGLILPGIGLMSAALGSRTAEIAASAARGPGPGRDEWFGRSTAEAVARGARFAVLAAIERAVARFPGNASPALLLTGGDAPALIDDLAAAGHRPLLVLEGLQRLEEER